MGLKRSRSASLSSSSDSESPFSRKTSADIKIVHLDAATVASRPAVMNCSLPPHAPLNFTSLEDYQVHYQKAHVNRCSECQRNFPDSHYLSLHITENHDPISAAKRDRGEKIYQCLVSTCDRPCSTPAKRRLHCIDKHGFPRNYDFFIINDGIDRRTSMLRPQHRRRSSTLSSIGAAGGRERASSNVTDAMQVVQDEHEQTAKGKADAPEVEEEEQVSTPRSPRAPVKLHGRGGFGRQGYRGRGRGRGRGGPHATDSPGNASSTKSADDPMEGLTSSVSALQFVPHSVHLAKSKGRGGAS